MGTVAALMTYKQPTGGSYNARAQEYFDQQEAINSFTIDDTRKGYINTFLGTLISLGFIHATDTTGASDSLKGAIYFFFFNSAGKTKINVLRPYDNDSDFRISYAGGLTHTDNQGTVGNGTTGIANTYFDPNAQTGGSGPWSWYVYSRTSAASGGMQGVIWLSDGANFRTGLFGPSQGKNYMGQLGDTVTISDFSGGHMATLRGTTDIEFYQDGASIGTSSNSNTNRPKGYFKLFGRHITNLDGTTNSNDQYDNHELALAMVAAMGFTDQQASDWHDAVAQLKSDIGW